VETKTKVMTITKAIAKIEKKLNVKVQKLDQLYFAAYGARTISFYQNGRGEDITCIKTNNVNDPEDSMSDYFPGNYHDNISQAIRFVSRN
jgi:hypothetical protein